MENYIKTVLYAYPLLKTVGEDYAQHIRNKALLSYDSRLNAEQLAEYLAGEILRKERLEWLKAVIDGVLNKLSDTERTLVSIRYFGRRRRIKDFKGSQPLDGLNPKVWSERKYFRFQQRLSEKVGAMLRMAGVTEELFEKELAKIDIFRKIHRFVEEGRDQKIAADERRILKI